MNIKKLSVVVLVIAMVAMFGTMLLASTAKAAVNVPQISRDLDVGFTGDDVKGLQKFLNSNGYTVVATGPGSLGNETTMFGNATKAALVKFQSANGLVATGILKSDTRALLAKLLAPVTVTTNASTPSTVTPSSVSTLTSEVQALKTLVATLQTQIKALQTKQTQLEALVGKDNSGSSSSSGSSSNSSAILISSIKVNALGDEGGIDEGDTIVVTFNKVINSESINEDLSAGSYVKNVDSDEVGGVSVDEDGILTITDIASFDVGDIDDSTDFTVKLSLNTTGKILTITLSGGSQMDIDESFGTAKQIGGQVDDEEGDITMKSASISKPTGSFGESVDEDEDPPTISSIKVSDGGDEAGINKGDKIVITFNEAIDPESINSDLEKGSYVDVDSDEIGGVIVDEDGILTITDIASFDVGDIDGSTEFEAQVALNSTGKILTITLTNGEEMTTDEDFGDAKQIGGTIIDENENEMDDDSSISDPSGTFGS
ncbi:MAG TPA: hypothetical protein DEB09_01450 [Candidatus Magasanikbacteria bacterium]|nr:hypothetical protein [Candidatus Magasanikbacteria bacterium]